MHDVLKGKEHSVPASLGSGVGMTVDAGWEPAESGCEVAGIGGSRNWQQYSQYDRLKRLGKEQHH